MPDREPRQIVPSGGGFIRNLAIWIKLVLRLMGDPRVNPLLKLLPIGSLVYLLIPEPILGPLDDATVMGLGLYLFVELCPPEIVQEHMAELTRVIPGDWRDPEEDQGEIIDAEFREDE